MSESKSIGKFFSNLFSKKGETKNVKLHYKPSKELEFDEDCSKSIHDKSKALKKQNAFSSDFSENTSQSINTQEFTNVDLTKNGHKTSSLDTDKNFKGQIFRLHYRPSREVDNDEVDSVIGTNNIHDKSKSLKRQYTCSFDLSDKTLRLINTQELTSFDSTANLHRTSSFDTDRDFPRKMLPITDFEEKEVLGEGAFGRAVKVQHIKSGGFFVLKEVVSHSNENEESLIREVSLLRSLKHDNILTTVGLVLKDKSICLLTVLMEGGSLQAKIKNLDEEISINQKLLFLRDIASGMNFLHRHSIIHRDLTSTNCLLKKDNTVVVSDFGLSKCLNENSRSTEHSERHKSTEYLCTSLIENNHFLDKSNRLDVNSTSKMRGFLSVGDLSDINKKVTSDSTDPPINHQSSEKRKSMNIRRKHTVVGNPFWMAPEMLAGQNYNSLVDIYSFGIIGCEVTARVSADPEYLDRFQKSMSINFEQFIQKNKCKELINCPEELLDLIESCCKPSPDDRPTFNTLLSWIEDILFKITNNIKLNMRMSRVLDSD